MSLEKAVNHGVHGEHGENKRTCVDQCICIRGEARDNYKIKFFAVLAVFAVVRIKVLT